jgi:hypothetical protein
LLIIGMAASLLISGAGSFSADRLMSKGKLSIPLRESSILKTPL